MAVAGGCGPGRAFPPVGVPPEPLMPAPVLIERPGMPMPVGGPPAFAFGELPFAAPPVVAPPLEVAPPDVVPPPGEIAPPPVVAPPDVAAEVIVPVVAELRVLTLKPGRPTGAAFVPVP